MKNIPNFISSLKNEALGTGIIFLIWSLSAMAYPAYVIPSPMEVLAGVTSLPQGFEHHLWITLYRVLAGFTLSLAVGTSLGTLAFAQKWGGQLNALMLALQVLPGTVLGVVFLLVCGLGSAVPILLIIFMVLPTLAINTYNGLYTKNRQLEEYLFTLKGKRSFLISTVYLPALVPILQSNLSLGVSMAVKVVVLGEFIGAQDGIGYLLNNARIFLDMKAVFFYLLILLIFTLIFQTLQSFVFSKFFRKYFYAG
jgi:NitT/TauT family transport system permease protein